MTLRSRLALAATLFAALVVLAFGGLAHLTFALQLDDQLEALLQADLERIATLLDRPTLGASFGGSGSDAVILQFVTADERVALWWGSDVPLPHVGRPTSLRRDGRSYLLAQAPWRAANGTIRLAHDVTAAMEARTGLTRALLSSGVLVVLVASLLALVGVRRMLWPLAELARRTRAIEASAAGRVAYDGPSDEVADVAHGLNEALAAIRSRREEERGFLLEVAHELAAPLTLVHYHLDGLRRDDPDDERLRAAADAARELLRTSQDLLAVGRGELDRALEHHVVDLRDVVRRVANEYPGVVVAAGPVAEVAGDPERLVQVVRNVVRNAVQASGAATGVRLALRTDDGVHVLRVQDDGPGMTIEARAHAFERGVSGGRGAGVGLAVARSITLRHGGTIAIVSSSPAGTTIELRLPSLASRIDPHDARGAAPAVSRT